MLKVQDNFIESPLFHLRLQFKFSNYYPLQNDVKLIYNKKRMTLNEIDTKPSLHLLKTTLNH